MHKEKPEMKHGYWTWYADFGSHSHVIGKIMFFLHVRLESMWHFIEVVFTNAADEARRLEHTHELHQHVATTHREELTSRSSLTCSSWSRSSPKASMIKPVGDRTADSVRFKIEFLTLNDGKEDNDNKEEERYVKEYPVSFVRISIWWFDFITDSSSGSDAHVQMENVALQV